MARDDFYNLYYVELIKAIKCSLDIFFKYLNIINMIKYNI